MDKIAWPLPNAIHKLIFMSENMGKQYIKTHSSLVINNKVHASLLHSIIFHYSISHEYSTHEERRKEMYRANDHVSLICIKWLQICWTRKNILSSELHDGIKDGTSFKYGYIKGVGTGLANYIEVWASLPRTQIKEELLIIEKRTPKQSKSQIPSPIIYSHVPLDWCFLQTCAMWLSITEAPTLHLKLTLKLTVPIKTQHRDVGACYHGNILCIIDIKMSNRDLVRGNWIWQV